MSQGAGAPPSDDEPVGVTLARMRQAKGLTGAKLAEMVGFSQPKISRIERGRGLVDPKDIGILARALGGSASTVRLLMERAEQAQNRMTDWRPAPINLAGRQATVAGWEASAKVVREVQPAVIPGLLQTSGYARAVLQSFQDLLQPSPEELTETAVVAAVSARLQRQRALADPARIFRFVITEAALGNRICRPADMLAQIDHLREASARPNIFLSVVPQSVTLTIPPLHGFMLFDDDLVLVDVYNTGLISRGRSDASFYRKVFDRFEKNATAVEPFLDNYQKVILQRILDGNQADEP